MSELKLELGEYYLNRSGQVRGPICDNMAHRRYKTNPLGDGDSRAYRADGRWQTNGVKDIWDLVEHIPLGDPRHPDFTPASKIPGMALKIAETGSIVESDGQAPKEVEAVVERSVPSVTHGYAEESTKGLELQVGEFYLLRNGVVAGPAKKSSYDIAAYPFDVASQTYTNSGSLYLNKQKSTLDIIEHVQITDERHPWHALGGEAESEELPAEEDKPLKVTAGRWITDYGYVITLGKDLRATHLCPGANDSGMSCKMMPGGSGRLGWYWEINGTITGLTPEWTAKLRIVGPAPETPEAPAGFKHKSPPEFRVPRRYERFISFVGPEVIGISRGQMTKARWIIETEVVSIPLQTEREWLGFDDQTRWVPTEQPTPVCELEERFCLVIGVGAMDGLSDEVVS